MVFVDLVNPTDQPIDVMAVMHFNNAPRAKFGRRMWAPPRSRRLAWAPIRTPSPLPEGEEILEVSTVLVDASKPTEDVFEVRTGEVFYSSLLPIERTAATGLISDTSVIENAPRDFAHEAIEAVRTSAGLTRSLHLLQDEFFPPTPEGLDSLDHLVLSSDRVGDDTAALAAIRRWTYAGGRLWIMLDRLSPETVGKILGDDFPCQVVDRVGLTTVRMAAVGENPSDVMDFFNQPRDYEEPVDFVRVVQEGADVVYTVDGWPAAFWLNAGRGKVLVTTLGARGWIRKRAAGDPSIANPLLVTEFVALPTLRELGADMFAPEEPAPIASAEFQPGLVEEIGYKIPSRGVVMGVLGVFCVGLLVGGAVLGKAGRREHLGWLAPAAALAAGGILAILGLATRKASPTQVAAGQFIEAASAVEDVHVTGTMGLYHQQPSDFPIGADDGGTFAPDLSGLDTVPRRIVWTEVDKWRYDNLRMPSGVRMADFSYSGRLDSPPTARASFGPQGLVGQANLKSLAAPGDALAAYSPTTPPLSVELEETGKFVSKATLARGEFMPGALLSDRQRRRQEIFRKLFSGKDGRFPKQPSLLVWSEPIDLGFAFQPETRRAGDALVSIPLVIDRTPPGQRVTIPSACLPFRPVLGPEATSVSAAYNPRTGEWLQLRSPSQCWLRFQLPSQVLPLALDRATVKLNIRAPSRKVEFRAARGDQSVLLESRTSPSGEEELSLEIADPALLQVDSRGGFLFGVWVGGLEGVPAEDEGQYDWQIETFSLDLSGVTSS